jgi:para-nitrobenzyl esterase
MHARWVKFAGTGDPGWPRYDTTRRATLRIDTGGGEVVDDPHGQLRGLWEGIR